jgi:hypothetical protein
MCAWFVRPAALAALAARLTRGSRVAERAAASATAAAAACITDHLPPSSDAVTMSPTAHAPRWRMSEETTAATVAESPDEAAARSIVAIPARVDSRNKKLSPELLPDLLPDLWILCSCLWLLSYIPNEAWPLTLL